jgi:heat-inducible transcriptional repressor
MLDERKAAILRAVVQEYIETGQPVGSGHVARAAGVAVSSATVRNEMAVLEQEGYLHQPHTSAGRVPTDRGYRQFVDHLVRPGRLDAGQTAQVHEFFSSAHGALESMLADTSRLLSGLTNLAAVVVGPPVEAATVRSVQLVGLSPRAALLVVVLSNGAVEKEVVESTTDGDLADELLARAGAHLSAGLAGTPLVNVQPVGPSGDPQLDAVVQRAEVALAAIAAQHDESVFVGGASTFAGAFDAVDVVRTGLTTLEQQYVVVSLLRDVLDRGLSVAIGAEHGVQPLAACSVVVAPYLVEGEPVGTIGVLGPTRMHYPEALVAVQVVSQQLTERLSEG